MNAVSKILLDKQLWKAMSTKAIERACEFSDKHFVERTVVLYKNVIKPLDPH